MQAMENHEFVLHLYMKFISKMNVHIQTSSVRTQVSKVRSICQYLFSELFIYLLWNCDGGIFYPCNFLNRTEKQPHGLCGRLGNEFVFAAESVFYSHVYFLQQPVSLHAIIMLVIHHQIEMTVYLQQGLIYYKVGNHMI